MALEKPKINYNSISKENILFTKGNPFSIKIQLIKRYPIHWHEDVVEILLPIKGTIDVIASHERVLVKEGDFIFINNNSFHSIQSSNEAIVAVFHIDLDFYMKKYEYIKYMYFRTNMYSEIYNKIESDNYDYLRRESKTLFKSKLMGILIDTFFNYELSDKIAWLYEEQIVESMINEFNWLQFLSPENMKQNNLDRYYRIVKYMQEHINEKIMLDDITSFIHISRNYFSHFWKNISNFGFVERVNFEKVVKSELSLLTTDKNIASISEELGFSDVKYYYSHFKKWYGCTPLNHRKRCFSFMKKEMMHKTLSSGETTKILDEYISNHSVSPFKNLKLEGEKYPIIEQLFSIDNEHFSENNMNILLDLFKYIKIENDEIKIDKYVIYQLILLTCAKNLNLTVKIDCTNADESWYIDVINNFFKFSLFHFGNNIMEKWDYFIKYNENVSLNHINKIQNIIQSSITNASFKFYLEI
ncbi:MAG: AraC family transcriptional regulator [Sedimentibacter sp.]